MPGRDPKPAGAGFAFEMLGVAMAYHHARRFPDPPGEYELVGELVLYELIYELVLAGPPRKGHAR